MTGSSAKSFTAKNAEDVQAAVEKMFSMMFNVSVRAKFSEVRQDMMPPGDVSGVFNFNKVPRGALVMTFPKETVFALLNNLYHKPFTELDKSGLSLVGELTNIVHGVFRARLNEKGFALGLGIPQVFAGGKQRIPDITWALWGEFESSAGAFHVVLAQTQLLTQS